jgi:hypothetical protein
MKRIKLITTGILGLSLLAACGPLKNQTSNENDVAHKAFEKFVSGDTSLLDSSKDQWFVPEFSDEAFDYEYTFLDLDGDKTDELLIQMEDDPGAFNSVFHYADGKIVCWYSDSVEAICYSYPLKNGLMVEEYDYGDQISYDIYCYQSAGEKEPVNHLFVQEEFSNSDSESNIPEYKVMDKDVTKEDFEKELKESVTDYLLDRSDWKKIG